MKLLPNLHLLVVPVAGFSLQHPFLRGPGDASDFSSPHIREVKIGQLNFLHTTDTHGWLGSHLLQPDYDADWGDFVSFVADFKTNRLDETQDLLLIDTGDKHDGNGLSDATTPNGIETSKIFNEQDYDLLTLGNHELYLPENSILEYATATSHKFKDKYVSSNVEFIDDSGHAVPFGNKFRYFQTENSKTRVLALSFMFNFRRFNNRTKVTPPLQEVSKEWFTEVTKKYSEQEVDLVLVFGHMPVTDLEDFEMIKMHNRLREIYPDTVIQYFGGHSHIRDYVILDEKSTALQSGRFAETVGFLSIDNVTSEDPRFSRRYIDFGKRSFKHHSRVEKLGLGSSKGRKISDQLRHLRDKLNLDQVFGYVPQNYYMSARPIQSEDNIYHLISNKILPRLQSRHTNNSIGRYIMINTGAVRYDLYKGPFTLDSEFIVLPFANEWNYLELPDRVASKVEVYLNKGPSIVSLAPPHATAQYVANSLAICPIVRDPALTEGYTTADDGGCKGDDIKHRSQLQYEIPNVVQHVQLKSGEPDDVVHFIFYSFLQPSVLQAVNQIVRDEGDRTSVYDDSSCKIYGGNSTKTLLREYIKELSQ